MKYRFFTFSTDCINTMFLSPIVRGSAVVSQNTSVKEKLNSVIQRSLIRMHYLGHFNNWISAAAFLRFWLQVIFVLIFFKEALIWLHETHMKILNINPLLRYIGFRFIILFVIICNCYLHTYGLRNTWRTLNPWKFSIDPSSVSDEALQSRIGRKHCKHIWTNIRCDTLAFATAAIFVRAGRN